MSSAWQAFLAMEPPTVTHNDLEVRRDRRTGRHYIGKSARLLDAEQAIESRIRPQAPDAPLGGALDVRIVWCFPTMGVHGQGEPMVDKPDVDNLAKTLLDCLARCGVIDDDAHIAHEDLTKAWMDPAGIFVRFSVVGEDDERA